MRWIKSNFNKNNHCFEDGKRYMRVRDDDIPYSDEFKIYMIYRGTSEEMMPEYELQTR